MMTITTHHPPQLQLQQQQLLYTNKLILLMIIVSMHHVHHALSSATIVVLMHAPITLAIVRFSRHRLSVLYDELEQKVRQPSISCLLCSHTICIKSTANTTLPPSNMESAWKTELGSILVCRMAKCCRCNRHRRRRCASASLCRWVIVAKFWADPWAWGSR